MNCPRTQPNSVPGLFSGVESDHAAVGMSRSAFALRFSVLLGESPIRYLARRRIARAVTLLEGRELSIAQIAADVGYESDVAFSRVFKGQVGLSPIDFRRANNSTKQTLQRS